MWYLSRGARPGLGHPGALALGSSAPKMEGTPDREGPGRPGALGSVWVTPKALALALGSKNRIPGLSLPLGSRPGLGRPGGGFCVGPLH